MTNKKTEPDYLACTVIAVVPVDQVERWSLGVICETCRNSGRPGFVAKPGNISGTAVAPGWIPCPDCGGSTVAHCCDGLTASNDQVPIRTCPRTGSNCYDARCARDWCQREEHYP